jgi:hypothetical protein
MRGFPSAMVGNVASRCIGLVRRKRPEAKYDRPPARMLRFQQRVALGGQVPPRGRKGTAPPGAKAAAPGDADVGHERSPRSPTWRRRGTPVPTFL